MTPQRSVLYMPGSNLRALEKSKTLAADVLIFDLEDAVAPSAKAVAREQVLAAVQGGGYGYREIVVRVNARSSRWYSDDMASFAKCDASALLVPKVESAIEILAIVDDMDANGSSESMDLWAMAESPRSILNINEIVDSHSRLKAIVMGTSDLAKDMRMPHTADRIGFIYALSHCVTAARAANINIFDGVHLNIDDDKGFKTVCKQGRALGFDGKTLIHPGQIAVANSVFSAGPDELAQAKQIMIAWEVAQSKNQGVVLVNNKLVEQLHVDEATRTLAVADLLALREQ